MKNIHILLILILTLIHNNVFADSWPPPAEEVYESKNGKYRLTVKPGDELNYFENSIKDIKKPGNSEAKRDECIGILEKKTANSYELLWKSELNNDVSPVSALVSDTGNYVVTFDNWSSEGRGDNVVVIYNENGKVIKTFRLEDILSPTETIRLSRSVLSTMWGRGHELDEENNLLVLKLLIRPFPYAGGAPGRKIAPESNEENIKWDQNKIKTIRRLRLSDGYIIDKPIIDKRFEYPKFECEREQHALQGPGGGARLWQMCIIDNGIKSKGSENNRHGKYQVSSFVNGAWFIETRGQYINGKRDGTWTQVFNEGDTPCVREYDNGDIVKEECPQGWWGSF